MKRDWKKKNLFASYSDRPDEIGEGCQFRKGGWEEAGTMTESARFGGTDGEVILWFHLPWLLSWIATNLVAENNTDLLSYGSGDQKSKFILSGLKSRGWLDNVPSGVFVCVCVCVCVCMLSWVQVFAVPWTAACQSPASMGFSRQGYWSRLPFSSPGDLPAPGIKPCIAGGFFTTAPPGKLLW